MNDFETNPKGTMKALHQANARANALEAQIAHLKPQWQAEALERAIKVMRQPFKEGGQPWLVHVEDLQAMADDYRRQAEEAS